MESQPAPRGDDRAEWALTDGCCSGDDSAESSETKATASQFRADALGLIAELALSRGLGAVERGEIYQVVVHVDGQALSDPCSEGLCELENGQHIPADTCRRLACDASTLTVTHGPDGGVLNVGRRSRKVTLPLWRALVSRDRMCQFPGCGRTGHLATHHIRHWAEGGVTEPESLILLCPFGTPPAAPGALRRPATHACRKDTDCTGSRSLGMGGVFLTRTCNSEGNTYGLRAGQNAKPDHAFG